MLFKHWLQRPQHWRTALLFVAPIIISQVLQRLYPVVDSRYISFLGSNALLIHSLQYNLVIFGQFIGVATAISCLVFWKRPECINQQGSIFKQLLVLVSVFMISIALFMGTQTVTLMNQYKVDPDYFRVAKTYFSIGLMNMILQAVHGSLDGMLIASGQQKKVLFIALALLIFNIAADLFIVTVIFSGTQSPASIYLPMILIAGSTTLAMLVACIIQIRYMIEKISGWEKISYRNLISVWQSEVGTYLIRGLTPFAYAWQLSRATASYGFFTTYQLSLQLSYFFCIPLIASLQFALRNAAETSSSLKDSNAIPSWWSELLYTGLLPSTFLLLLGMLFPTIMMFVIFRYNIPQSHMMFVPLFFFACIVGQFANAATIPIRARKHSYLITRNFFLSEFIVMLGGTQLLIFFGLCTPLNIGIVILAFTATQLLLNLLCIKKLDG